jgi:hypothetical protein
LATGQPRKLLVSMHQVGHKAFRIKMGLLKYNYTQVKKEAVHTKLFQ